jgi:hypothetical protein
VSTSMLVMILYEAEGLERSLTSEVANSWYLPHWKDSIADISKLLIGVGRPYSKFKSKR